MPKVYQGCSKTSSKGKVNYLLWEVFELPNYNQIGVFLGIVKEFTINHLVQF